MKRFLTLAICFIVLLSLAACTSSSAPASEPTAVPATGEPVHLTPDPTEAPTEEPTAEPTAEPAEIVDAYFEQLELDVPLSVDLDGDGALDTVTVHRDVLRESEYFTEYYTSVTITLAAKPDEPFEQRMDGCDMGVAVAADFDPDDGRIEIVFSYDEESSDYVTYVWRVNEEGTGIDAFEEDMAFGDRDYFFDGYPEDYSFDPEEGLPCWKRTEILGTFYVEGRFTVTKDGIRDITEKYEYHVSHDNEYWRMTLERELTLTLLDAELNEAGEVTLPVGTVIFQKYTDLESWVIIETEDGRLYKASVSIVESGEDWGIYLNGVNQDELAQIPYAD